MDTSAFKLIGAFALATIGLLGWWLLRGAPSQPQATLGTARSSAKRVVDQALARHRGRLRAIQDRSRFSTSSFERDCLGVARRVIAHPHYAAPKPTEGIDRLLEQTYHALGYRQTMLLPPDAPPEDIEHRSFRWTFAVFVASMLSDLRWSDAWVPARAPAIAHATQPANLLRASLSPWLDSTSLEWLLEDELLQQHLQAFFSSRQGHSVLHWLVSQGLHATTGAGVAPVQVPAPNPYDSSAAVASALEPSPRAETHEAVEVPSDSAGPAPAIDLAPLPLASQFMNWLAEGIAGESIKVNAPGSRVHFVSDGMALVAPGIFQDYAAAHAGALTTDIAAFGKDVQKAVCAEGWHLRGPQDAHLHRFRINAAGDAKAPGVLKAVVIQAPQRFVARVPASNTALARLM